MDLRLLETQSLPPAHAASPQIATSMASRGSKITGSPDFFGMAGGDRLGGRGGWPWGDCVPTVRWVTWPFCGGFVGNCKPSWFGCFRQNLTPHGMCLGWILLLDMSLMSPLCLRYINHLNLCEPRTNISWEISSGAKMCQQQSYWHQVPWKVPNKLSWSAAFGGQKHWKMYQN